MASRDLTMGIIHLSQTLFGILGNFLLLYHYSVLYFSGCQPRATDLILKHLLIANSLALLCKGVPQTMAAFGLKDFFNDFACKLVFYLHRVGRGVSFGSTCLLNLIQLIIISPKNSRWAELKTKSPKSISSSILVCWILHMLVNIIVPLYLTGLRWNVNITGNKEYGYCSSVVHDEITTSLYVALLVTPDVLCLGLTIWASSSIVFILYRHKKRVQHLHRTNITPKCSPESRATQSILTLMSTVVFFYTLSSIFQVCIVLLNNPSLLMVNISALCNTCFPATCPFILMSHDSSLYRRCFVCLRYA
ncbi:vomeronasal type-1 receptor 4-like [Tamandua tetradactyla]|uniref:vomeronasal type-1 receptor 4-like n=1 Tax=Tamandua tetradactyla TaxID=48850 RepID=UPI0040544B0F